MIIVKLIFFLSLSVFFFWLLRLCYDWYKVKRKAYDLVRANYLRTINYQARRDYKAAKKKLFDAVFGVCFCLVGFGYFTLKGITVFINDLKQYGWL